MGFRFYKRVPLGNGLGVNVSSSGANLSYRGRWGSLSSKRFTLRTGLPGLQFSQSYGRGRGRKKQNAMANLFLAILIVLIVWNLIRFLIWVIPEIGKLLVRCYYYLTKKAPPQAAVAETEWVTNSVQ